MRSLTCVKAHIAVKPMPPVFFCVGQGGRVRGKEEGEEKRKGIKEEGDKRKGKVREGENLAR